MKSQLIELLKKNDVIKVGDFTLKSGKQSSYYVDFRNLISIPDVFYILCKYMSNLLPNHKNYYICGLPYAGIPYCSVISTMKMIPMIMLRKEQKKYGTKKMIEGSIKPGDEIVLLDDILTTGSSIIESLEYFKEYKIKKVIVLLDRMEGGRERLEKLGYQVESLFSINDFI
jgi:uridine monophosphate synthetase